MAEYLNQYFEGSIFLPEKFQEIKNLDKFYQINQRNDTSEDKYNPWAMDVQKQFLRQRFQNELDQSNYDHSIIILDRCIYEDYFVFAKSLLSLGYFNEAEWNEYKRDYEEMLK